MAVRVAGSVVSVLSLQPVRVHLPRPDVADAVIHPLLDDIEPSRSAAVDLDGGQYVRTLPGQVAVYQVVLAGRVQVGLLLEVSITDYVEGRIRPHEATRPQAVDALADHLDRCGVDVAPVTLTHRVAPAVNALLATVVHTPPTLEAVGPDGAAHRVWLVDEDRVAPALDRLARVDALYVVDGHHRCAAELRLAEHHGRLRPGSGATAQLFAVVVAEDQLAVASYHLLVSGVEDPPDVVVHAVGGRLGVAPTPVDVSAMEAIEPGQIGMWCGGRWYRYDTAGPAPTADAVTVHDEVLGPVFGIADPDEDPRLVHVPGTTDPRSLETHGTEGTVAFVLHPPPIASLFAAADRGEVMPPKSSYFSPKVPAGLFVRSRR